MNICDSESEEISNATGTEQQVQEKMEVLGLPKIKCPSMLHPEKPVTQLWLDKKNTYLGTRLTCEACGSAFRKNTRTFF
ncbi:hypothetical protein M1146_06095 [Patescibacteria group bacterium]|nr:hypothetical protein [Patescibacteria group bacterium]